jgi:hypothetical protein
MRALILFAAGALLVAYSVNTVQAEETCPVAASAMMSKSAMAKILQDRGYTQIRSLSAHDGCFEAKGLDKNGKRFELELNGKTGDIVNAE